ncbi:HNH endonuclease [Rhodococcus phage MacGully]|nr:HNH endonuclease [Rhodococcus phage MacGully]
MSRAPKTCSWRSEDGRVGCGRTAVVAPNGDDFRCADHQRKAWNGQSDRRRRVPPLLEISKDFIRKRDFHVCRECGEPAHQVDHIIEVADGGTNAPDNLQLLCDYHHAQKTRSRQEAWKTDDVRRGTSSRAQAKRRARGRGVYQQ